MLKFVDCFLKAERLVQLHFDPGSVKCERLLHIAGTLTCGRVVSVVAYHYDKNCGVPISWNFKLTA